MAWEIEYLYRATKLAYQSPTNAHHVRDWNDLEDEILSRNVQQCRSLFELCEERNCMGSHVILSMLFEHPEFSTGWE